MRKLNENKTQHLQGGICVSIGQSGHCLNCVARIAVAGGLAGGIGPGGAADLICIA